MVGPLNPDNPGKEFSKELGEDMGKNPGKDLLARSGATRRTAIGLILGAPLLGACSGIQQSLSQFSTPSGASQPAPGPAAPPQPAGAAARRAAPPRQAVAVGSGGAKVGLMRPLSAAGNAGVAAQSMKRAAEMALTEC